jgi:hypothetical protein
MSAALAKLMARMKTPGLVAGGAAAGAGAMYGGDKLLDEMYPARRWVPKALQGPLMDAKSAIEDPSTQQLLMALGIPLAGALIPGGAEIIRRLQDVGGSSKNPR